MVGQDHFVVEVIDEIELFNVVGGVSITGSIINAFSNALKTIYGFGQDFGGGLRRIITKNVCKF